MKTVHVRLDFDIDVPDDVDEDQITDWIAWEINFAKSIDGSNPLIEQELEPKPFTYECAID